MAHPSLSPIPDLCPPRSLSLITGSFYTGAHEFALGLCADLIAGRPILGRIPYVGVRTALPPRVGWLSITHGDPELEQRALVERMEDHGLVDLYNHPSFAACALSTAEFTAGLDDKHHICPLTPSMLKQAFSGRFGTAAQSRTDLALPEFLILDDLHLLLVDSPSTSVFHVTRLILSLLDTLRRCNIACLAFAPAVKQKTGEHYSQVAERINGTVYWAARTSSIWCVEKIVPDVKTVRQQQEHRLTVVAGKQLTEVHALEVDSRGLLVTSSLAELETPVESDESRWLASLTPGVVTRADLIASAAPFSLSRSFIDRRVNSGKLAGRVEKSGEYGMYRILPAM